MCRPSPVWRTDSIKFIPKCRLHTIRSRSKWRFYDRIIARISEATIVMESAEKGGSLVTADLAHSYHREVFAVPGRTTDKWSKGCNGLIKYQRAHLLTSAAELVYLLGWKIQGR
ncbi:DNA-processing protein DprA [Flagellimonas halotolerans]|uniref:DNA-processing protein DprA n=1 Tax=Flagellimonas halotolerans TaxID=3112164 RepID=A0ABU6ILG2_9FLAO|nr:MULTISPECIES: DNA-processing protein DprA [unclassified Allomuricauda]MEC3964016.1 DNA-processing protein DprA [Muricauda sp. SYSU M86414]MEC4263886.1 DNA-processing protein DprA [Muricauda sp. SYSU M84420]